MSVVHRNASVATAGVRPEAGDDGGGGATLQGAGRLRAYVESVLATERRRSEAKSKPTANVDPAPSSEPASESESKSESKPASEVTAAVTSLFPMLSLDPAVLVPTEVKRGRGEDEDKDDSKRSKRLPFDFTMRMAITKAWANNNARCLADLKTLYHAAVIAGPRAAEANDDGFLDVHDPVARAMINHVNGGKNALGKAIGDLASGFTDFETDFIGMTGVSSEQFSGASSIDSEKLSAFLLRLMNILIVGGSTNAYFVVQEYSVEIDDLNSEVKATREIMFPLNFALSPHKMEYDDPNDSTSDPELLAPIEDFKQLVSKSDAGIPEQFQALVLLSHFLSSPQLKTYTTAEQGSNLSAFGDALFKAAEETQESMKLPRVHGSGFFSKFDYEKNPHMYVAKDRPDKDSEEYVQYTTSDIFECQNGWKSYEQRTSNVYNQKRPC